jgi:hypothetical protein
MNLKPFASALVLLSGLAQADTVVWDFDQYKLTYDNSSDFRDLNIAFGSGDNLGFNWIVPDDASVSSVGTFTPTFALAGTNVTFVSLPSFTVTAKAGWALSDLKGFLGNLSFTEVGGATTGVLVYAKVAIDGGPSVEVDGAGLGWTIQSSEAGVVTGYFADTYMLPGGFTSVTVSDASLALSASGGVFSSITANNQNKLEVTFTAQPVPEPETYAMMLAGLGALGWMARRRRTQG